MKSKYLFISLLTIISVSCKTSKIQTQAPQETYNPIALNNQISTIGMAIDMNIPELERSLNSSFKGLIYEDKDFTDDNMLIKVWKTNDIRFTMKGNMITYQLPVKIWFKTGFKKEVMGVTLQDYYEATGALMIEMSSVFSVEKDWNLKTHSKIRNYEWTEEPKLKAIGVNIPVTTLTNLIIKAFNAKIISSIDENISKKSDLRSTMQKTWYELQDPMHVNEGVNVWIKMQPKSISATPILGVNNRILMNVGVYSIIDTYVGLQPEVSLVKSDVPDYKTCHAIKPDFSIQSNIAVPYKKLSDLAAQFVVGKEFTKGKKKIVIDSISMYGQADKLVVKVDVKGSVNGSIYCIGKPIYCTDTKCLTISEFDFEMNTKSGLAKSANWLLHKQFLNMIEPMLTIPLSDQINSMMKASNDMLKDYPFSKGVYISGKLTNIDLQGISITKDALIIGGKIDGTIKINVKDFF